MLKANRVIRSGDMFYVQFMGEVKLLRLIGKNKEKSLESKASNVEYAEVLYRGITKRINIKKLEDLGEPRQFKTKAS